MKQNKYYSFLLLILVVMLGACKEQSKENTKETPKTEEMQKAQEPQAQQTASVKYQSHNYYKNNVTEYLEIKADGSVFYSTSARPNQIKMIVTNENNGDSFYDQIIEFPKGTGDETRYGMKKSDETLIVGIPNTKAAPQTYTRRIETSQTEDLQVTQPQQVYEMTGPKLREKGEIYESYNYYGTSARPKEVKMIVSKAGFSGYILQFPRGAGDNQRYGMKKSDIGITITTPNGKKQRYDRKYE